MATTRFIDHLLEGDHASRPAAGDVPEGTLYSCTTHSLVYQSDTSTWTTWATLGSGAATLDALLAASSGEDIADALTGAAAPDAGNVFATMADVGGGGALVLLEHHTASNSGTLDFTTFLSSTYDEYMIEVVGLKPATNATSLYMRMGTGGGPTYDSSNIYSTAAWRWVNGGGNAITANDPATQIYIDGGAGTDTLRNDDTYIWFTGSFKLFNPAPGTIYPSLFGHSQWINTSPASEMAQVQARYGSHTSITAVRFLMSSGNITSGDIRIYGIAKT